MNEYDDPDVGVDANGVPTEQITIGDQTVVLHYDDIPESHHRTCAAG